MKNKKINTKSEKEMNSSLEKTAKHIFWIGIIAGVICTLIVLVL